MELGDWITQDIEKKWVWWSVPDESRIYQQNNDNWFYYCQDFRRFYLDDETDTYPLDLALSISVVPVAPSFCIEGSVAVFNLLPSVNALSEFEDDFSWSTLQEGFDNAIIDQTILLDKFVLPEDMCQALVQNIRNGTASIVSDCSFNVASPIRPAGTLAVILAPSTVGHKKNTGQKDRTGSPAWKHYSRPTAVSLLVSFHPLQYWIFSYVTTTSRTVQ